MANCVTVKTPRLCFNNTEFDIPNYKIFIEDCKKNINSDNSVSYRDNDAYWNAMINGWWFLERNSIITDTHIIIELGHGRSCHTTRDLTETISILKAFILKDFECVLSVRDDDYPLNYGEKIKVNIKEKLTSEIFKTKILIPVFGLEALPALNYEEGTDSQGCYCKLYNDKGDNALYNKRNEIDKIISDMEYYTGLSIDYRWSKTPTDEKVEIRERKRTRLLDLIKERHV